MTTKRKTIAVDIDDVLSASAEGFAAFSNKRWNAGITAADYLEEWAVVWNVPLEEAIRRATEFHKSGVIGTYRHFEYAVPVLDQLHTQYNLVAVTSRRAVVKADTDAWMERYFPGLFEEVHYVGMWDTDHAHDVSRRLQATKTEICKELGAEYLIDDQLKHCIGAAKAGIVALLFGEYAWNQTAEKLPAKVIRVKDWGQVAEYFNAGTN